MEHVRGSHAVHLQTAKYALAVRNSVGYVKVDTLNNLSLIHNVWQSLQITAVKLNTVLIVQAP